MPAIDVAVPIDPRNAVPAGSPSASPPGLPKGQGRTDFRAALSQVRPSHDPAPAPADSAEHPASPTPPPAPCDLPASDAETPVENDAVETPPEVVPHGAALEAVGLQMLLTPETVPEPLETAESASAPVRFDSGPGVPPPRFLDQSFLPPRASLPQNSAELEHPASQTGKDPLGAPPPELTTGLANAGFRISNATPAASTGQPVLAADDDPQAPDKARQISADVLASLQAKITSLETGDSPDSASPVHSRPVEQTLPDAAWRGVAVRELAHSVPPGSATRSDGQLAQAIHAAVAAAESSNPQVSDLPPAVEVQPVSGDVMAVVEDETPPASDDAPAEGAEEVEPGTDLESSDRAPAVTGRLHSEAHNVQPEEPRSLRDRMESDGRSEAAPRKRRDRDDAATPVAATPGERPMIGQHLTARPAETRGVERPLEFAAVLPQVMHGLRAAAGGEQAIRIHLDPPDLGRLQVDVTVSQGTVTARLEAESASTHRLLQENLSQLRDAITQQGMTLDRLVVEHHGEGSRLDTADRSFSQQQQSRDETPRQQEWLIDEQDARGARPRPPGARRGNGRLDVQV